MIDKQVPKLFKKRSKQNSLPFPYYGKDITGDSASAQKNTVVIKNKKKNKGEYRWEK